MNSFKSKHRNLDYFEKSYYNDVELDYIEFKTEAYKTPKTIYISDLEEKMKKEIIPKLNDIYYKYAGKGNVKYNPRNPNQIKEYIKIQEDEIGAWDVIYSKKEANQTFGQTIMYGKDKYHITPNGLNLK